MSHIQYQWPFVFNYLPVTSDRVTTSVFQAPVVLPRNNLLFTQVSWQRYKFHQQELSPLLVMLNWWGKNSIYEKVCQISSKYNLWKTRCFYWFIQLTVHLDALFSFSGDICLNFCVSISAENGLWQNLLSKYSIFPKTPNIHVYSKTVLTQ